MPLAPPHARWKRLLAGGVASAFAASIVLAAIPVLFGSPLPMVYVHWRGIGAADRIAAERSLRLSEPALVDGDVWSYVPHDRSPEALVAIVAHPAVEDTDGIDRRAFTIVDPPALTPRRGGLLGNTSPWMARGARLLAYVLMCLSGVLLLYGGVSSPPLGPGSPMRRRIRAELTDPSSTLRTLPQAARLKVLGVTAKSAETIAVVLVFAGTVAWRLLTFTGFTNDHYAHLALAQQMLMGDWPIRDFSDPGWPLTYLLTAAGWLVAGDAMATEWTIVAAGFALGAACTLVVANRLSGSLAIALLVTVLEVLVLPRSYSYPKMLVYGAGAWTILALAAEPTRRRIVFTALVVAIAFLFRHDHGLFVGVASAVCLGLASRGDGWRVAVGRVAALTLASAAFLLPWTLYVAFNGGIVEYFQAGLEYSRGEASATRLTSLPLPTLTPFEFSMTNAEAWLFWLFWSLPLLCGVMIWRRARRQEERWRGELAAVTALVVVSLLVTASFVREALQVRLPDAIVPAALLGSWVLGACWIDRWRRPALQRIVQVTAAACVLASGIAVGRISGLPEQYDNSGIKQGAGGVRARAVEVLQLLREPHRRDTPSRFSTALAPFFEYLDRCTPQTARLIVTGEFPDVLALAGRRFAGDGVVFGAWYSSSIHQDRTIERLRLQPALFVLHMGDYDAFRERFALVDRHLNEEYDPMAAVPVEGAGAIQILVHRARPAAGTDPETGWPCFTGLL